METIDKILKSLWDLLCLMASFFMSAIKLIARFVKAAWNTFSKIRTFSILTKKCNSLFDKVADLWDSKIFILFRVNLSDGFKSCKAVLDNSVRARRWFFLISAILLLFYIYPPSAWGPWYHYQRGIASHYGKGFYLKKTAAQKRLMPFKYAAAHKTLPLGTLVLVKNRLNGRKVYVRINDRGPYLKGRIIDLSTSAAKKLKMVENGTAEVDIYTKRPYKP